MMFSGCARGEGDEGGGGGAQKEGLEVSRVKEEERCR